MTQVPASQRKIDGGHIKGAANVPSVIEIKQVISIADGKPAVNIFHGFYTTVPPNMQTVANGLFTSLSNAWATSLGAHMDTGSVFERVEIRDMTDHTLPVFIGTGTPVSGNDATGTLPGEMAAVLTENIVARGKGLKGRVYLGGWGLTANAGAGLIAPTSVTAINTYGTAVFSAITAQGLTPCVAQVARQQYTGLVGTLHQLRPAGHSNVTTYSCRDNHWDSQRRRGLK